MIKSILSYQHTLAGLMIAALLMSGCTSPKLEASTEKNIVVHKQLPKNLITQSLVISHLSTGVSVKGNIKYRSRRIRFLRPKGTLLLKITDVNGNVLVKKSMTLNKRGMMPNYSHFHFKIDTVLPKTSHLYLEYL